MCVCEREWLGRWAVAKYPALKAGLFLLEVAAHFTSHRCVCVCAARTHNSARVQWGGGVEGREI